MKHNKQIEAAAPKANHNGLTHRQILAIPHLLGSRSYEQGRKKARISKESLYRWLKDPAFVAEMERQRNEIVREALAGLKAATLKAVAELVRLTESENEGVRRLACVNIIDYAIRATEAAEIEERLSELERRVFGVWRK